MVWILMNYAREQMYIYLSMNDVAEEVWKSDPGGFYRKRTGNT
jgi:hypothetical protein